MPICPRCERNVSYQELDVHERYCEGRPEEPGSPRAREQLEAKITYLEGRFEERVSELEKEMERRLARAERFGQLRLERRARK